MCETKRDANVRYSLGFGIRWGIAMPKIIANSISLVSDAGLGMAMFSLGKWTYAEQFELIDLSYLILDVYTYVYLYVAKLGFDNESDLGIATHCVIVR